MPTAKGEPTLVRTTAPTGELNLAGKLARIADEVGRVEKKGFNQFHKYQYVRESDLTDAVRPLLARENIWLQQNVSSHDRIDRGDSGLSIITIDFTWVDGASGETLGPVTFIGYGEDKGDKGIYKALTGCLKYFLMKTFLISTGDDPEADENTDKRAEARGAAAAPTIRRGAAVGVGRGGKQETATDAQVHEVIRLAKEAGITGADLVIITGRALDTVIDLGDGDPREAMLTFLKNLTAPNIGKVIAALAALKDNSPVDDFDILGTDTTGEV